MKDRLVERKAAGSLMLHDSLSSRFQKRGVVRMAVENVRNRRIASSDKIMHRFLKIRRLEADFNLNAHRTR